MHQDTLVEPIRPSPRLGPGRVPSANTRLGASPRGQGVWLVIWLTAGGIFFGHSLWVWAKYAWGSELYSYLLIIPFMRLYLAWSKARPILMNSWPVHRETGEVRDGVFVVDGSTAGRPSFITRELLAASFGRRCTTPFCVSRDAGPSTRDRVSVARVLT